MKNYRVDYNEADEDGDNWATTVVSANTPDEAVFKARYETKDSGTDYICMGEI